MVEDARDRTREIYAALREYSKIPTDIVVSTTGRFERYRNVVNTVYWPAAREGRVLYERASEVIEVMQLWVRKAEHDLQAATRIMAIEEGCPYDTVCFHCQQAIEKYLIALLTSAGIQAPRSHDLAELAALVPAGTRITLPGAELADVSPYAVDEPRRADAIRAMEMAERVREEARGLLPPEALV